MKRTVKNLSVRDKIILGVAVGVAGYFGFKLVKNAIQGALKSAQDSKTDSSLETQQAQQLRIAMNPTGNNWMRDFDGTDAQAILNIARGVVDFSKVQQAYSNLYQSSLTADLQSELSTNDYAAFINITNQSSRNSGNTKVPKPVNPISGKPITAGYRVIIPVSKVTNVRTSPDIPAFYQHQNILTKQTGPLYLGFATGKDQVTKGGVRFIEVCAELLSTKTKKIVDKRYFWVANSNVELYATTAEVQKKYPKIDLFGNWLIKNTGKVSGLGLAETKIVVSAKTTQIYDLDMKPTVVAPSNIVLGFPVLELDNKKIQFRNIENQLRWVNSEDARVVER